MAKIKDYLESLRNRGISRYAILAAALFLFMSATIYTAIKSSEIFSTNSDALIATQQFSHGVFGQTIGLPAPHSNILMIPLLFIQGHLQYTYTSFVALNLLLMLTTFGAWILLLIRLFGRKYEAIIILTVTSLVFVSTSLTLNIANTTFRNIAYPISLLFIINLSKILQLKRYSRRNLVEISISGALFTLVLAGDSFFNYAVILPIGIYVACYLLFGGKLSRQIKMLLVATGVPVVIAYVMKLLLSATNIIHYDHTLHAPPTVLPISHLAPSIQVYLRQLLDLQGAMIFNKAIHLSNLIIFINLSILVIGIAGIIYILKNSYTHIQQNKLQKDNDFTFAIVAISFLVVSLEYILSGYAVVEYNGAIVDYLNARYITFLPMIIVLGFAWFVANRNIRKVVIYLFCGAMVIGMIYHIPSIRSAYAYEDQQKKTPSRASINEINQILKDNNVEHVITDFWYGPPVNFWSKGTISYAPQMFCNAPMSFDARTDWYRPKANTRSALIIDRGTLNYWYWQCSDDKIKNIYGIAEKEIEVDGVQSNDKVKIWIYDYDTRLKLLPFPSN